MMDKVKKQEYIEKMSSQFDKSEAVIVTHYQGLTMQQLDDLRSRMREHGIQFKITKNRITKLALQKTRCKDLSDLFSGPTAVALSEDASARSSARRSTSRAPGWRCRSSPRSSPRSSRSTAAPRSTRCRSSSATFRARCGCRSCPSTRTWARSSRARWSRAR